MSIPDALEDGNVFAATSPQPAFPRSTPTAHTSGRRNFKLYGAVLVASTLLMDGSLSTWFAEERPEAPMQSNERPTHRLRLNSLRRDTPGSPTRLEAVRTVGTVEEGGRLLLVTPQGSEDGLTMLGQSLNEHGYHYESVAPVSHEAVADALRDRTVRMVLIDVQRLAEADLAAVLDIRRRFPAVDWVLAWHTPSNRWADLAVQFRARGCIECDDVDNAARGIDAVLAGGFWFPEWLMHALYAKLLSALREGRVDMPASSAGAQGSLTRRETQTLDLMRQGLTNKQIALRLQISVNTVKKHLKNAFDKRGMHSRRQGLL